MWSSSSSSQASSQDSVFSTAFSAITQPNWKLWHSKLGHPHHSILNNVLSSLGLSKNKTHTTMIHCTSYLHGKMHKLPFHSSQFVATHAFELVHSDV